MRRIFLTLLLFALSAPLFAASRYDPSLRFRTLATRHFTIYFHRGEERLAGRLAVIAEQVHDELTRRLRTEPGRTYLVLVDQDDSPNGAATPLPYNTIEIVAAWPKGEDIIGNTDDWLRLVLTHEYTHILQLDRSVGFAAFLRAIFGRAPISFPNLTLPRWQIEGLATFEESAVTGRGRLPGGDFQTIIDQAARADRLQPLDRASSDIAAWPSGTTPYLYGGYFYAYLARRFGEERLAELGKETAGRFFYLAAPSFRKVFGRSLGELWNDFERDRATSLPSVSDARPAPSRLTRHGFVVAGPRFLRGQAAAGMPDNEPPIAYSMRNADDFPALVSVGAHGSRSRQLATRYGGDQTTVAAGLVVFDQLEVVRNVALQSDLYAASPEGGDVRRLTVGARLAEPDLDLPGRRLACIRFRGGQRQLVIFELPAGVPVSAEAWESALHGPPSASFAEPDTEYASPRWSPDGQRLAAERRRLNGPSDLVEIDAARGLVRVVVTSPKGRNVAPAWTPDGRWLLFASDRERDRFDLYALDTGAAGSAASRSDADIYRVSSSPGGALYPDVSPDGRLIVFVGSTADGYDLFTLPFDPATWQPVTSAGPVPSSLLVSASVSASASAFASASACASASAFASESDQRPPMDASATDGRPYSPWATLWPRFWLPDAASEDNQFKVGAQMAGSDALGRHAYAASVLWRVASDAPRIGNQARPDWRVSYAYDRWLPTFFADASDKTTPLPVVAPGSPGPVRWVELRERDLEMGVHLPLARVRHRQFLYTSLNLQGHTLTDGDVATTHGRNALRFAWAFASAKTYGYSISREQGIDAAIASEQVRRGLGADGDADAVTAEARAYLRLGGRHRILAVRGGLGASSGDSLVRRTFYLGGAGPNAALVDFGSDALSLLRGFTDNGFTGTHVAVINADYRFPIAWVERGHGTWPVFLRCLHGTVFFDAGQTWTPRFALQNTKTALGGELAADVLAGYSLPLTLAVGAAWTQDHSVPGSRGAALYARLGRAF